MKKLITIISLGLCSVASSAANPFPFDYEGLGEEPIPWSLKQCIEYALEHNISIKQQQKTVENSEIQLNTARSARLPSLNASANQSFSFGRGLTSDNTYTNRGTQSTGFDLGTSIPLITGGQIPNTIAVRKIDLQAALADLEKAREDISLQVTSQYLECLYQKELMEVAERQCELSKNQLRRIKLLFDNGKKSEADLAEAQSAVANDELTLTQATNSYDLTLLTLSQLLELDTPQGFAVEKPAEASSALAALNQAPSADGLEYSTRPSIIAQQYRLKSAERNIRIAKAGYYPSLNFSAGLGSSYYKTSGFQADPFGTQMKNNFNQYLSFSLSIPIFNRFTTRNAVRQARVAVENQRLALENTRKALYKEMQQAYYNAVAAQKQYQSSQTACDAASASFNLMQKKYENGKANSTEFEEQKTRYMKAQADHLQAKYTYIFRQKILNYYRGEPLY
ncbi:MAG: TolC family protein [Bacteroidaceae bacterium]|nr:TolC family protein [Bacteroidaceae bacterium]